MSQITSDKRVVEITDDNLIDNENETDRAMGTAARVVYLLTGMLMTLLAFRFLLSLLGANRNNQFADFIYSLSQPFVQPFFGLFNFTPEYGIARFEIETLFAMAVYGFLAWVAIRLLTLGGNEARA